MLSKRDRWWAYNLVIRTRGSRGTHRYTHHMSRQSRRRIRHRLRRHKQHMLIGPYWAVPNRDYRQDNLPGPSDFAQCPPRRAYRSSDPSKAARCRPRRIHRTVGQYWAVPGRSGSHYKRPDPSTAGRCRPHTLYTRSDPSRPASYPQRMACRLPNPMTLCRFRRHKRCRSDRRRCTPRRRRRCRSQSCWCTSSRSRRIRFRHLRQCIRWHRHMRRRSGDNRRGNSCTW